MHGVQHEHLPLINDIIHFLFLILLLVCYLLGKMSYEKVHLLHKVLHVLHHHTPGPHYELFHPQAGHVLVLVLHRHTPVHVLLIIDDYSYTLAISRTPTILLSMSSTSYFSILLNLSYISSLTSGLSSCILSVKSVRLKQQAMYNVDNIAMHSFTLIN